MPSFPPVSCLYLDARRREGRKSLKKMWKIPNRQPRNTQRQAGPPWSPLIFFFFPQGDQWSPLVPPVGSPVKHRFRTRVRVFWAFSSARLKNEKKNARSEKTRKKTRVRKKRKKNARSEKTKKNARLKNGKKTRVRKKREQKRAFEKRKKKTRVRKSGSLMFTWGGFSNARRKSGFFKRASSFSNARSKKPLFRTRV